MLGLMRVPDHGTRRQKDQAPLRDAVTEYTQEVLVQRLDYVSIYRAGSSGSARSPAQPTWAAGAGSGTGAGISPPAIKAFRGEFPGGKEGVLPS